MNSITRSIQKSPSPSPSSTKKNKSFLRKMLSSANRFLTGQKKTPKSMTKKEKEELEEWGNKLIEKEKEEKEKTKKMETEMINKLKKRLENERKAEEKLNTKISENINKSLPQVPTNIPFKRGCKKNKTKRSNNSKNKKTQKNRK